MLCSRDSLADSTAQQVLDAQAVFQQVDDAPTMSRKIW